jgi:hypothetical protein
VECVLVSVSLGSNSNRSGSLVETVRIRKIPR